ncbi:MAG: energy transducer TonB [Acidobacteriota bacterium]
MGSGGLTDPVILVQTLPHYTDEGIRAKVQGVVLLQGVIRRTSHVTDLQVLRGLGYGLDEQAISCIVKEWSSGRAWQTDARLTLFARSK